MKQKIALYDKIYFIYLKHIIVNTTGRGYVTSCIKQNTPQATQLIQSKFISCMIKHRHRHCNRQVPTLLINITLFRFGFNEMRVLLTFVKLAHLKSMPLFSNLFANIFESINYTILITAIIFLFNNYMSINLRLINLYNLNH